jgi:hypothetical protein
MDVELRFAILRVLPEHRTVETRFPDGHVAIATRDDTPENRETAVDLGYTDSAAGVWASLVHHEALHSLLADWAHDMASPVLRHCAGAARVPYLERIFEECAVLGFQQFLNTGNEHPALRRFRRVDLDVWRSHARTWLAKVDA